MVGPRGIKGVAVPEAALVEARLGLQVPLPDAYALAPEDELLERIQRARAALGDRLVVLGHHYQADEVIRYADVTGDSYKLAKDGAAVDAEFIVFLGVHFMAESAAILARPHQQVILPDLSAGCSMADMATLAQVEEAWRALEESGLAERTVPITYMNSSAAIKAFCGERGGAVCTSSNARRLLEWAFERGERVLFLPDQHLGRNVGVQMGVPLEAMAVWDPDRAGGGLGRKAMGDARFLLWKGHCAVHQRFQVSDVERVRRMDPAMRVIVHPECAHEVVRLADEVGSTEYIIQVVAASPPGSRWSVGTELHLVHRLAALHPDRHVESLSAFMCLCTTMYRIDPPHLAWALEELVAGRVVNRITVPARVARGARLALDRMLAATATR